MLCLSALLDCNAFHGTSLEKSPNSDIFILFLSQSVNSGQVAVLEREGTEASLSCRVLSLRLLIEQGDSFQVTEGLPLCGESVLSAAFCMRMTSFCQFSSVFFASFREFHDFYPFTLVQASQLLPSPAFLQPDHDALITAEAPEAL